MAKIKSLDKPTLRELNFLCAFILSEKFCSLFHKVFRPQYFQNPDYKTLVAYIQTYFEKYSRPPRKLIISYVDKHKNRFQDEQLFESLKKTLLAAGESMDELLEKYESQYIIDDAELFIKAAELRKMAEDIQLALDNDDDENAIKVYQSVIVPEVQRSGVISFEDDLDKQREALGKNTNMIVHFKGEVGQLIGPLYRGDFFSWVAPTGTGKSWWLMWCAKQCRAQGLNVLFLSLEMQEQSILRRFQQMYYRRPLFGKETGEKIVLPKLIKDGDKYNLSHKNIDLPVLAPEDVSELKLKAMGKHPHGRLKIVCRAGINIGDLKAILSELKYQSKFVPDAIVLDYADKMTTAKRVSSERESLGIIWKDLRDLALDHNCLLMTASQTNRTAWDKHFDRDKIAEDYRKLNEVTSAIGIMSTKKEREKGLLMLRLMKTRDGWFEHRDVYCVCNFSIGQPNLQSCWANDLNWDAEGDKEESSGIASRRKKLKASKRAKT